MAYTTPVAADLAMYLGSTLDSTRASYVISLAEKVCLAVVTPLPVGAEAIVLDVAARAYTNPQNAESETVGPYSSSFGAVAGGLWLTRRNEATLRRLGGTGGAFTVDPTPLTTSAGNVWRQIPLDTTLAPYGDWDPIP